jgi:hypothetical protein
VSAPHGYFKKEKANHVSMIGLYLCRQRPEFTLSEVGGLPHTLACTGVPSTPGFGVMGGSTIGPAGLNLRR